MLKLFRIDSRQLKRLSAIEAKTSQSPIFSGDETRLRIWPYVIILCVTFTALFFRLTQLTLVEGAYQRNKADQNRVLALRQTAPRGVFFDRQGIPLVTNVPFYKRQVPGSTVHEAKFEPLEKNEALALAFSESGERIVYDIKREYPCGRACASILGYTGEITEAELQTLGTEYVSGDSLGKTGLEKLYERTIRGLPGTIKLEVTALGQETRTIGEAIPQKGGDINLTLDMGLQQTLYEALEGKKGAVVAQVPETGEILAMVSSPAYNPNDIVGSLAEKDEPFFNRAIAGVYPPGSVFKVITATAGLETGKLTEETLFEDSGEITVGPYRYGNWYFDQYGKTEGKINVVRALQRSNDIFFYRVGETVGAEKMAEWARLFGLGDSAGMDALGGAAGTVPDPVWKEKTKGERWFLGNTYHMAIGQGDVLTTPLQINRMMGAIAAKGSLCPVILSQDEVGKASCTQLNLQETTLNLLHSGLIKACEPGGTGVPFFRAPYKVGCKTGTAQQGGETALPHAWFTVYAPAEKPTIVLTVMMEHAGQGSEVAAPVAKKGIDYWLTKKIGMANRE